MNVATTSSVESKALMPAGECDLTASRLKVAFAVGELYKEGSGVTRVVCDLGEALADADVDLTVFTADCDGRRIDPSIVPANCRLAVSDAKYCGRLMWSPALKRVLADRMPKIDVVHNHGIWMLPTSYAARRARACGVPVVYTIHGYLEPWALQHSGWKKRLISRMFQRRDLEAADCLHVLTHAEIAGVREYGLSNPIAVIPNGVDVSAFEVLPPRDAWDLQYPELRGKRIVLFLSRLHKKKGLGHLVEAWSRLAVDFREWRLVIAGPDDGYEGELRAKLHALGVEDSVVLTGPLFGAEKVAAYAAADVYALPSFSEGFSMAILEAMAARTPVLLTPGCNFDEAVERRAAVSVAADAADTERGLRALMGLSDAERREMGERGRSLVAADYSWAAVSRKMLELYDWLRGKSPRPVFVIEFFGRDTDR